MVEDHWVRAEGVVHKFMHMQYIHSLVCQGVAELGSIQTAHEYHPCKLPVPILGSDLGVHWILKSVRV